MEARPFGGFLRRLGMYSIWLTLSALAGVAAWYAYLALINLAALAVSNPALRPVGWSTATINGVSKLSIVVLGSLWLIAVSLMEYRLREALSEGRVLRQTGHFVLAIAIVFLFSYALLFLV